MVRQLGREIIEKYTWLERANITMGYSANLLFDFADLDELCKDIEGELDSHSLGAGFSSQGQRIDEFVEHRSALLSYTSDVLYDIDEYLENPLYKGFNNAVDLMAAIDMRDAKTDNTIGLQEHTSMYVGAGMYDEVGGDMTSLNLEDFIGSRNKNNSLTNYQKVDDFAELFAKDYEDLVNNDKIDPSKVNLQEYLDSLVLKEFAHKKDAPFWKELLESLSEMTVVIPIIEAATGKTLITGDYLTGDERAFKVVSGAVSLVTLGYGAAIAKGGGMALAKMFAADILAEAVSGSTVIVCDKAGVPSAVTVALAIVLGSTTGVIADKALLKNGIKVTGVDEVDSIKSGSNSEAFDYYMDLVEELDVSTTPNSATFYSGQGNRALAEEFAKVNGKTTLEMTSGGKYLDDLKLFEQGSPLTQEEAVNVWARLSTRYAQNASGNTYGFVKNSWEGSIFNTIEYPALKENSNVTNIFTELMQ
ncbi:pre-toxin TG domain-containing protein [Clostridium sp. KNHs205]|uniref:pre-toxin TG domain-containing protein n=1 Tax=Clostridium sp. KNHs205 TaxID=1449050 RepID=UPI00068D2F66|nr:pre-toxin TG domain-containing protein [Clostridium sp. KNHs205]